MGPSEPAHHGMRTRDELGTGSKNGCGFCVSLQTQNSEVGGCEKPSVEIFEVGLLKTKTTDNTKALEGSGTGWGEGGGPGSR